MSQSKDVFLQLHLEFIHVYIVSLKHDSNL